MPTKILGFNGDPAHKEAVLAAMQEHIAADKLIKGTYWTHDKGCAIGCLVHGSNHATAARLVGVPLQLMFVFDEIFEGLPDVLAQKWPMTFLNAIQVGVDYEMVWPKLVVWLLNDPYSGLIQRLGTGNKERLLAASRTLELYGRWLNGDKPNIVEWDRAVRLRVTAGADIVEAVAFSACAPTELFAGATLRSALEFFTWYDFRDQLLRIINEIGMTVTVFQCPTCGRIWSQEKVPGHDPDDQSPQETPLVAFCSQECDDGGGPTGYMLEINDPSQQSE